MHRFRACWLSAAVVAGAGTPAAVAADPPPTTLAAKWFGPSKPKPKQKVGPVARGSAATSLRPPTVTAPLPAEVVAGALRAEQDAWERRISVCDKLREVALEANDEALMRQVDELERQATALYNARVAALGVPKVKPAPAEVLDRTLGTGVAVTPLTAPAAPTAADTAVRTAEARTTDVIREVRP